MINIDQIKKLREETGVSISECKKALVQAKGDLKKAKEILKSWGRELAEKKLERKTEAGLIDFYLHPNKKVGVMLDIRCESDFVANNKDFQNLAHELCLQIAAMNPLFLKEKDAPKGFSGNKKEASLLSQVWIKDETKTIQDLINDCIAKIGENIVVKRFIRYEI